MRVPLRLRRQGYLYCGGTRHAPPQPLPTHPPLRPSPAPRVLAAVFNPQPDPKSWPPAPYPFQWQQFIIFCTFILGFFLIGVGTAQLNKRWTVKRYGGRIPWLYANLDFLLQCLWSGFNIWLMIYVVKYLVPPENTPYKVRCTIKEESCHCGSWSRGQGRPGAAESAAPPSGSPWRMCLAVARDGHGRLLPAHPVHHQEGGSQLQVSGERERQAGSGSGRGSGGDRPADAFHLACAPAPPCLLPARRRLAFLQFLGPLIVCVMSIAIMNAASAWRAGEGVGTQLCRRSCRRGLHAACRVQRSQRSGHCALARPPADHCRPALLHRPVCHHP